MLAISNFKSLKMCAMICVVCFQSYFKFINKRSFGAWLSRPNLRLISFLLKQRLLNLVSLFLFQNIFLHLFVLLISLFLSKLVGIIEIIFVFSSCGCSSLNASTFVELPVWFCNPEEKDAVKYDIKQDSNSLNRLSILIFACFPPQV